MLPTLKTLIQTNRILEKRKDDNDVGYYSFVGLFSSIIFFMLVGIFYDGSVDTQELIIVFCYLTLMVLFIDISLVFMKYRRKAAIEPLNLKVYPLTQLQKFNFFLYLLLFDYKTIVYGVAALTMLAYFFYKSLILSGLISLLLWLLLAVTSAVWMLAIYRIISTFGQQIRERLMQIFIFIYLAPAILGGFSEYLGIENYSAVLLKIPVSSQAASVLYGLLTGNNILVLQNFGFLFLILLFGLTAYRLSPSNY
ncbi:MAG: hypothetical protein WC967_14415 [Balneolaceae bacterium]